MLRWGCLVWPSSFQDHSQGLQAARANEHTEVQTSMGMHLTHGNKPTATYQHTDTQTHTAVKLQAGGRCWAQPAASLQPHSAMLSTLAMYGARL